MVPLQRSLSSPVNKDLSSAPTTSAPHGLPRSPTPPLLDGREKHVDLSHFPPSVHASRSFARRVEANMSYPNRRSDGASRRTSAGPLTVPPTLTNLMVSSKTTAAAATTATVTATATTSSMISGMSSISSPTDDSLPNMGPPLAASPDVASMPAPTYTSSTPHRPAVTQIHPPIPPSIHDLSASAQGGSPDQKNMSYSTSEASPPTSPADISGLKYQFSAKPLLQDTSLYSNGRVAAESEGTSLNELAHLVRLSKYQERKRTQTRTRLQLNLISTALSARLVRCGEMAHRNLTECFRSDDRTGFANLYNAVHNVRKSCDELRKYALFEPELDALRSPASSESLDTAVDASSLNGNAPAPGTISATPFFNDLSADAREIFISFLTNIRNNPDYLATRLCSLSTAELSALTSFYQGMEPIDSVLPFHSSRPSSTRGGSASGRTTSINTSVGGGPSKDVGVQKLLSFQRHDPLSALIHTCFANSAGPDSAEDRRRTDIWATTCARLISEKGAAGEPVLVTVLNAWSSMREWSGRSNMEWFLMKILEDGAFLLDRAEDQNGTRFHINDWTAKDQIAADEFYDRAVNDLFDVIDDEDATGIPEGLIELGNQVLKKLDAKFVDNTRSWFVYKWLFGAWLLSVIIHPETHGLMAEYHITEYGRQKILKEVALRAQKLVVEKTMSMSHTKNIPVSTPPLIKVHIENIMNKFRDSKAYRPTARLLPARSITSLRETVEVHPYLVVSPADLVTMVNALFPERRPRSAQSGSFRSGPGSISNFSMTSQPVPVHTQRSNADTYSVLSTSVSSATSDATTSVEPLLESQQTGTSSFRSSPPPPSISGADQRRLNSYEDDGYRLRLAIQDMAHSLGRDCVLGSCHPCAERWAVLFISPDGNTLSTQMTYDPDEDDEIEEDGTSSSDDTDDASEDELSGPDKTELDTDYHHLRNSILKLVEDYEIPQGLDPGTGATHTFSNRANRLKKYRNKNRVITTETSRLSKASSPLQSRNPYLRHTDSNGEYSTAPSIHQPSDSLDAHESQGSHQTDAGKRPTTANSEDEPEVHESVLISMLKAASSQSHAQSDFLAAHQYWNTIKQLNALNSQSLRQNGFAALLNIFSRGPRDLIRRSAAAVEEYEAWLIWLKQSQERAEGAIDTMMRRLRALRDKMWYVTDVRNSGPYDFTRNIAVALKTMGTSRKWNAYQRSRLGNQRGPAASYLYRTESEIVELLAATESQGGPNKLSDDQAEKTARWLQQCGIANFCQGEERIHRFSCEIASCTDKLIGESIVDAPVLWSSDLFMRDRHHLESSSRSGGRDLDTPGTPWDDASSIRSFDSDSRRFGLNRRPSTSLRGDLRATLGQNNPSVQSFDSGRYSFSRASTSFSEVLGGQDFFSGGLHSPVPAIDTSNTFWSPFQASISPSTATSRAQSPTSSSTNLSSPFASMNQTSRRPLFSRHGGADGMQTPSHMSGNGRPGTSASSVDTIFQQRMSEEKSRFLNDLRQTLTSLLLSDLGNLVFARGSETDHWFSSLGQECIERREAIEKRQRHEAAVEKKRRNNRNSLKQIVVDNSERKNDMSDTRTVTAGSAGSASDLSPSTMSRRSNTPDATGSGSHGNDSSATASDHTATAARHERSPLHTTSKPATVPASKKTSTTTEFPFTKAYQRLLRMFCVHPSPQAKLAALFELENLITASLSSRSTRRRLALLTKSGTSPVVSHATAGQSSAETTILGSSTNRPKPLEEAIDNVKGRRSSTLGSLQHPSMSRRGSIGAMGHGSSGHTSGHNSNSQTKDAVACILQSLFCDPSIRPKTLFRDLQFIAAFVPPEILDRSERGKSFWAAGLAALLLKSEVCTTMIEVADEIVGIYTKTRKAPTAPPPPPPPSAASSAGDGSNNGSPSSSPFSLPLPLSSAYSLADAARMLTITAKEGDPTSQRELAIFYLSNPELVERTTLPLSKPREVFKKAVMEKYGGSGGSVGGGSSGMMSGGPGGGPGSHGHGHHGHHGHHGGSHSGSGVYDVRNDPALMCVAIHWMEAAEQGGDELARTFLGQNEMMK